MKKVISALFVMVVGLATACAQSTIKPERVVGGRCENCELLFAGMPDRISWKTKLIADDEPGEPMIIRGTIYTIDGKTPAPDVILYLYQTDHTGHYTPAPNQVHAK